MAGLAQALEPVEVERIAAGRKRDHVMDLLRDPSALRAQRVLVEP